MAVKILLVNPAIYDFAAYDFWLKPYGLLSVAGLLRGQAEFKLFDYMDRLRGSMENIKQQGSDEWGRGRFWGRKIETPEVLSDTPRYFRRFGVPREVFADFLKSHEQCDFVFVQTMMTYWYLGVEEVIEDVRKFWPGAKIVLGGNYATLCREHAEGLGADLVIEGTNLEPLWKFTGLAPDENGLSLWELYHRLEVGVLKLSDGCPFKCTYCSVPKVYGGFRARSLDKALNELQLLVSLGVRNIAFYDDALLFKAEETIGPFLQEVIRRKYPVNFHTPNALNARFITADVAELLVRGGFKTFYLGFESASADWQRQTGGKVFSEEFASAVENLSRAGADKKLITAYQIIGHPRGQMQQMEESMKFVNSLGIRGMLADFSPIPGTSDGDLCSQWIDMDEPLLHNKTAFTIKMLGNGRADELKNLQRKLNSVIIGK